MFHQVDILEIKKVLSTLSNVVLFYGIVLSFNRSGKDL